MPRGRNSRAAAPVRRAVAEALEERRLLTTLSAKDGQTTTFDYYDANKNTFEIVLTGNITAEFIGARVTGRNGVVIRDLVSPPPPNSTVTVDGVNLFSIYVASADPDASIVITQMTTVDNRLVPSPYGGSAGSLRYVNTETGKSTLGTIDGAGSAYIGARTVLVGTDATTANIPITYNPYHAAIGVRPSTHGIYAGLQTAKGVSLGKVYIDGTVTGIVNVAGNLGTWYSGSLLTGDTIGAGTTAAATVRNNFQTGGDLRNLIVQGSVGTISGTNYRSGTEIRIGGKLGYQLVGNDFVSALSVINSGAIPGITTPVQEIETTLLTNETVGDAFVAGNLSGAFFSNSAYSGTSTTANQYSAAQFASTYTSSTTGATQAEEFQGSLDGLHGDIEDNYGVPLMAGQKIGVYLNAGLLANVAIFDPLGRLVETDLPTVQGAGSNTPFQFTAKLPGVYRFAVGLPSDPALNTNANQVTVAVSYATTYTLNLSNLGNVSLGGAEISGATTLQQENAGINIRSGDLGAWVDGTDFAAVLGSTVTVRKGNLRALYAANIGTTVNAAERWPDLIVPAGGVGNLLATGNIVINPSAQTLNGDPDEDFAVGFDYQRVEAGLAMNGNLVTNGSIGTVIGGSIAAGTIPQVPIFSANTAGGRNRGTIDMLYTNGDFGSAINGGPGLYTGLGGNVKYIHVGGQTYRDPAFGSSLDVAITKQQGESLTYTDDSGARVTVVPTTFTPASTSTTGTTTATPIAGTLTAVLYPVREAGGLVAIDISSTTGMTINGLNSGGSVDIGHLGVYTAENGTEATYDDVSRSFGYDNATTTTGTGTTTTTKLPLTPDETATLTMTGRAPVNVLSIDDVSGGPGFGAVRPTPAVPTQQDGNLTSINNATPGEIATVNLNSIGTITAQNLGTLAATTAAAVVIPSNIVGPIPFPYDAYSTGVEIAGSIINASARDGIGNIHAGTGIGTIVANADGKNASGLFDGIGGNIEATVIQSVRIGEGIADAGTGGLPTTGLFAVSQPTILAEIDSVTGSNADIRGVIASEGVIGGIRLNNGSLNGALIITPSNISDSAYANRLYVIEQSTILQPTTTDTTGTTTGTTTSQITLYANTLGSIHIVGNGGILGSYINVGDFAAIDVDGGFGIIASDIAAKGTSTTSGIVSTDGFGIQYSGIDAGTSINRISARGDGSVLSVASYNARVRQSEKSKFDAYTGRQLTYTNDLNRFFGTTKSEPAISGVTNGGLISNDVITGSTNLGTLEAYAILGGYTDNSVSQTSSSYPMRVLFGNQINLIKTASAISGLQVRTGKLNTLTSGGNMLYVSANVVGAIGTVAAGRSMYGSVTINAKGPEGTIGTVYARNTMTATVVSDKKIGTISAGYFGGNVQTSQGIGTITIKNNILGSGYIRASGVINTLTVGGSILEGATVQASSIGQEVVGGHIDGSVIQTT